MVILPGQYYDSETGLHQNYFRTYDPSIGRYISSDPIGLRGGYNTFTYVRNQPLFWLDPFGLREVSSVTVQNSTSTVSVSYTDGGSKTYPAAVGDGKSYPGADSTGTGTVKGTAWGPVGPWPNAGTSWSESKNPDNPFGVAIILLNGTDSRHIHGTNGPLRGGIPYIGGINPDERRFSHGCARLTNQDIIELKRDIDETLKKVKNIPVIFN